MKILAVICMVITVLSASCTPRQGGGKINHRDLENQQKATSKSHEMHFARGMTYYNEKNYGKAVIEFDRSIAIHPSARAYANLGVAYMKSGKDKKALFALLEAVAMDDCHRYAWYTLAALYSLMEKKEAGLDALDRSLTCGFNDYETLMSDRELENIRKEPGFSKILEKHKVVAH